jgi:hypothetical protein
MPQFQLKPGILTQPVSIDIEGAGPAIEALVNNSAPGGTSITYAQGSLSVTGGTKLTFASGTEGVDFHAEAASKIAIFPSPETLKPALTEGLDLADQLDPALDFPRLANTHLALLRWNYDIGATTTGSMALGAGPSITGTVDAGRGALYAIVRQIPDDGRGCNDIVRDLIGSWCLPKQVTDLRSIPPGTWIISEVNGSLGFNIQATYGHDFNWVRKIAVGGLTGDIGLKLQMGLSASVGFTATGKHAIVLSRASDRDASKLRLRLYRLAVGDLKAGASASAIAQVSQTGIPDNYEDLIGGILGISGTQVVKALKGLDVWSNPGQPLLGPLVGVGEDYVNGFLKSVTGFDANTEATKIRDLLTSFFSKWNSLPQSTTTLIWSHLPEAGIIASIAQFADSITSSDKLVDLLANQLKDVKFFATPEGKWLESLAPDTLFAALASTGDLSTIRKYAGTVRDLLNGTNFTNLLTKLHDEIGKRLNLEQIESAVNNGTVANLDKWLAQRLETFLNQNVPLIIDDLRSLRDQIHKLEGLAHTWYTKGLDALTHKYTASIAATYQRTTTNTALLDIVFDFSPATADDARACLAQALDGKLQDLLTNPRHPSLTLNQGALTHGIRRQTEVELHLPYFDQTSSHISNVIASLNAVDQAEGRLLTAGVNAQDTAGLARNRNQRNGTLAVAVALNDLVTKAGVTIHEPPTASCSYTLSESDDSLSRTNFERRYAEVIRAYFPNQFAVLADVRKWISAAMPAGDIGKGTISLSVTVPSKAVLTWRKAPIDSKDSVYKTLANTLIAQYRDLLIREYLANTSNYNLVGTLSPTFALLAYTSTPVVNSATYNNTNHDLTLEMDMKSNDLYWDYRNPDLRNAMLNCEPTRDRLAVKLTDIRNILTDMGKPKLADRYSGDKNNLDAIITAAMTRPDIDLLFKVEAETVKCAREAGLAFARAYQGGASAPGVLEQLAKFGAVFSDAFSSGLNNWLSGDTLLPLGSILLAEASSVLAAIADPPIQLSAMFTVDTKNLAAPQRLLALPKSAAAPAAKITSA